MTNFVVPYRQFPDQAQVIGQVAFGPTYLFLPPTLTIPVDMPGVMLTVNFSVIIPNVYGILVPEITYSYTVPETVSGGEGSQAEFVMGDSYALTLGHKVTSTALFVDSASVQANVVINDLMNFQTAAVIKLAGSTIQQTFDLSDTYTGNLISGKIITDALEVATTLRFAVGLSMTQAMVLSASQAPAYGFTAHDNLNIVGTPAPALKLSVSSADLIAFLATPNRPSDHVTATDDLKIVETVTKQNTTHGSLSAAFTMSGEADRQYRMTLELQDDLGIAEHLTPAQLLHILASERIKLSATFVTPSTTAWAMNTRSAAVSEYANYKFNSFAKMGGRYVAANDNGLFFVDGGTDAGVSIPSSFSTGALQLDGTHITHPVSAYVSARGDGSYVFTVTDEKGDSYSYEYALTTTNMRTARVLFGKGLRSRYFTFTVASDGQDFDLDSIELMSEATARKITA